MMRVIVLVACAACSYSPPNEGDDDDMADAPAPGTVRTVTFHNAESTTELRDAPILIPIGATEIDHALVMDPTTQLRFHDRQTAADLAFEIDRWDPDGESLVWVRVPAIAAGSETDTIELHFGPDAAGVQDAEAVWADYELVHHLDDALLDSAGNGYDGSKLDATETAGQIGRAQQFAGDGMQRITFASTGTLFDGWSTFTLELWLRLDDTLISGVDDDSSVIGKGGPMSLGRVFTPNSTTVVFQTDFAFTDPTIGDNGAFQNTAIGLGEWTYLAYSYDGVTLRMFENGAQVRSEDHPSRLIDGTNPVLLGGNNAAQATIDEVRISQSARNLDWLRAQHRSMTRQFVTISTP